MPKLLANMGYVDDGVDCYKCLNCKNDINIRYSKWGNPIAFCPYCGVEFNGGWIKDGRPVRNKLKYEASQNKFQLYWQLQTLEQSYHSDGEPFPDNWENNGKFYRENRAELLNHQRELIKEFKNRRETFWGHKVEFKTRLVYIKYEANKKVENTGRYGKETILAIVKETCETVYQKDKRYELT